LILLCRNAVLCKSLAVDPFKIAFFGIPSEGTLRRFGGIIALGFAKQRQKIYFVAVLVPSSRAGSNTVLRGRREHGWPAC